MVFHEIPVATTAVAHFMCRSELAGRLYREISDSDKGLSGETYVKDVGICSELDFIILL